MECQICHQELELPEWERESLYHHFDELTGESLLVCEECTEQVILRNFDGQRPPGNDEILLGSELDEFSREDYKEFLRENPEMRFQKFQD